MTTRLTTWPPSSAPICGPPGTRGAVAKDALLHADRGREARPGVLMYTRPDILAYTALAAGRQPANAYHLGYDGPPDLVVEILSESTWKKDVGVGREIADKMRHYQSVGVSEYWIYNPELLQQKKGIPFFTGYALQGNRYAPIERSGDCWPSAVLGTMWERGDQHRAEGSEFYTLMRLRKPGSTEWYPTLDEKDAELDAKDALLADPQALLDYYERRFGPLDQGRSRA